MPTVSQTIRLRRHRQARAVSSPWLELGLISALIISLGVFTLSMIGISLYVDLTHNLPSVEVLPTLLDPPNGFLLKPTRIIDHVREHVLLTLENPAARDEQYLYITQNGQVGGSLVSHYLVDATISAIDPGFWHHPGFTLAGINESSHTTLAQILVSDLLLDNEPPSVKRNIRERLLAAQVTAEFGREKVLEWYLNSAQYGETLYGADAAARVYFGKSATNISLAQAAILVALAEKPSINPLMGSQILSQKQESIIHQMFVSGLVTGDEALGALKERVQFQPQTTAQSLAPAFTQLVLSQLNPVVPLQRLYRGGYDIVTTLDYDLQLQADCAARAQTARLTGAQEVTSALDGSPCEAGSLLPQLQAGMEQLPEDLQAEVVILEPHTGQVLAMVGEGGSGILPSSPSAHPAGTILSPFMYLTAFTRGMNPATLLWDIPDGNQIDTSSSNGTQVTFSQAKGYHGPVSLREAFANDYPGAANEVLQQVGLDNVLLTEKQFGLGNSDLPGGPGSALEDLYARNVTLLDSVHAYSVLANLGVMTGKLNSGEFTGNDRISIDPISVLKVERADGQVWLDWTTSDQLPVVNKQIVYMTTNVLSDEKVRWAALGHPNVLDIGRPAAAKLNVNEEADSSWTVGYVPQLVVGVWTGFSQGAKVGITAEMPAGLWHAIIKYATNEMPVEDFSQPPGISLVQVCVPSGLLVSPLCPTIAQEVFLTGDEPTQVDNLYRKYFVNRETGLLATIFTPTEMVEDKVFLDVPPQAKAWAKATGLEISPDTYDSLAIPSPSSANAQILAPQMFAYVAGKIDLTGSATGEDFSYYRLQVGQGLNPQKWLQIGGDVTTPIEGGTLGSWDTTGLEGLYIVQLQVVSHDRRIVLANLQLTVDNTAPEVKISSPQSGEQYRFQQGMTIMMNAAVNDNLALQQVEFYIDGELQTTLVEPPYVILWDGVPGKHTLVVRAIDLAGNQSETSISFNVAH